MIISKDVTANRCDFIGGSDIAAIMGMSRWKTPYRLWAEKTKKIELRDLSNIEAVELGTDLEEFVAQKFSQRTGKTVRRAPKVYQHPRYPFMVAHIDRLITGTDEGLECKTASTFKTEEWENDIPKEYVLQCQWYMGITGRKVWWIAVLIGGQKFLYKRIDFDKELFDLMVEKAVRFWEMVKKQEPPVLLPEYGGNLLEVYPTNTDKMIEMQEIEDRAAYRQELKMQISEIEKEIKEIDTELKGIIGENAGIITDKYKITWKERKTSYLNAEAFKEDNPKMAQKYTATRTTRFFVISKNRKEF